MMHEPPTRLRSSTRGLGSGAPQLGERQRAVAYGASRSRAFEWAPCVLGLRFASAHRCKRLAKPQHAPMRSAGTNNAHRPSLPDHVDSPRENAGAGPEVIGRGCVEVSQRARDRSARPTQKRSVEELERGVSIALPRGRAYPSALIHAPHTRDRSRNRPLHFTLCSKHDRSYISQAHALALAPIRMCLVNVRGLRRRRRSTRRRGFERREYPRWSLCSRRLDNPEHGRHRRDERGWD